MEFPACPEIENRGSYIEYDGEMLEISCVVVQYEDLFLSNIFEWVLLNFPLPSSFKSQSSTVFREICFTFGHDI